MLAEIDSFCSHYESCYASNEHFAKFIGVSTRRIQDIIKALEDKQLIEREVTYKKGSKEIEKRFLRVRYPSRRKPHEGGEESFMGGGEENCADNIPSMNKTKKVNIYSYADAKSDTFKEAWRGFVDMRKAMKKPMTPKAAKMILNKLEKFAGADEERKAAILDKSTVRCWTDVYELKEDSPASSKSYGISKEEQAKRLVEETLASLRG